jgi:hypothetical protein
MGGAMGAADFTQAFSRSPLTILPPPDERIGWFAMLVASGPGCWKESTNLDRPCR